MKFFEWWKENRPKFDALKGSFIYKFLPQKYRNIIEALVLFIDNVIAQQTPKTQSEGLFMSANFTQSVLPIGEYHINP